jgi:cyclohexa-1,5-dienecarbonyl-CoA hydratase
MSYQFINLEPKLHRLDVSLNNPPVNILNGAVIRELSDALRQISTDRSVRVVVMKGAGKAWSAGADVGEHLPGKFDEMLDLFGDLCELVRTYPVPTIAAVDGLCLGGGCELALMCDFVIASTRARFGQPEIKVGVFPPVAAAHFVMKIGWQNAMQVILTGDTFDAESAARLELVTKVVPVESFEADVDAFAARLSANSGAVLRAAKKACLEGMRLSPEMAAQEADRIYRKELMATEDAVEGLTAFLEKRTPNWLDR